MVGEAADGAQAVALVEQLRPDVAIMDISMPVMTGIEATTRIKTIHPNTAILILSAYDDDQYVFALLAAGAAGYLLKDVPAAELVRAVRLVHAGSRCSIPPSPVSAGQVRGTGGAGESRTCGAQRRAFAHRPRAGGAAACRLRSQQRRDLVPALPQRPHGAGAPHAYLRQARRRLAHRAGHRGLEEALLKLEDLGEG